MGAITLEAEIGGERHTVFVPEAATGERVRALVDAEGRPARGRLLAVLEPSAARVAPPCTAIDRCGGCDWKFLTPDEQAREHARIVGRQPLRLAPGGFSQATETFEMFPHTSHVESVVVLTPGVRSNGTA